MLTRSTRALVLMLVAAGLTGCETSAPTTEAVPCVVLKPRTDALRAGLLSHPETVDAVGQPATDIVLGTEAVCK